MTWVPDVEFWGATEDPLMLVLHGTGSNPDFVRRTFMPAVTQRGYSLGAYRLRGHGRSPGDGPYSLERHVEDLADLVAQLKPAAIGGISLGAHIAATWAGTGEMPGSVRGLAIALPAWTGAPDAVAAANGQQAREIERLGVAKCLERLRADLAGTSASWVADEMAATWEEHDERAFCRVLDAVAGSRAPDPALLRTITLPVGIAAVTDDPLHPWAVAHEWAAALPLATVRELTVADFGTDRGALGEAALAALDISGSR